MIDPKLAVLGECLKLIVQFGGALLIARIAVKWALKRYKSEKLWERRLVVFADVLSSLRDLRSVYGDYEEEAIQGHDYTSEYHVALGERLRKANAVLRETSSHARLLLPPETAATIDGLEKSLSNLTQQETSRLDYAQTAWDLVDKAAEAVLFEGQRVLGAKTIGQVN